MVEVGWMLVVLVCGAEGDGRLVRLMRSAAVRCGRVCRSPTCYCVHGSARLLLMPAQMARSR